MRKFVSIAGLICIVFILAGCSVRIAEPGTVEPPISFENKSGEIVSIPYNLPDAKLPVMVGVSFEKTNGTLELAITDPDGAEVFKDQIQANDTSRHQKPVPETIKYNWGYYSINKVMEKSGTYTINITGTDATGMLATTANTYNGVYFSSFSGTAVKMTTEVTDTSKELGINLATIQPPNDKGIITARILDPEGKEIKNTRMVTSDDKAAQFTMWEKPAKTGTYTVLIEAKEATGSAMGNFFTEKPIPWMAFLKPILILLIGIGIYLMIKSKDRKVMVWGGLFWLISTFLISILFGTILSGVTNSFMGPYGPLTAGYINTISLSIISILILYFSRYLNEIKNAVPTELVAFAYGFVFVNPILAGVSGLLDISNKNGSLVPGLTSMQVPGVYPSSGLAAFDIGISVVNMVGQILVVFSAIIMFLWVLRQKEQVSKTTLWLVGAGAVAIKIVVDAAYLYSNQAMAKLIFNQPIAASRFTFDIASPMNEVLLATGIIVVLAALAIANWKKIMGLAIKACPVTIDEFTRKEEK
jgi:hypothetical protein